MQQARSHFRPTCHTHSSKSTVHGDRCSSPWQELGWRRKVLRQALTVWKWNRFCELLSQDHKKEVRFVPFWSRAATLSHNFRSLQMKTIFGPTREGEGIFVLGVIYLSFKSTGHFENKLLWAESKNKPMIWPSCAGGSLLQISPFATSFSTDKAPRPTKAGPLSCLR